MAKQGSGKNGNVVKRDWCKLLVTVVCKGVPEAERDAIVTSLCGAEKKVADIEVLCAMSGLDPENQQGFSKLHKMAVESLETKIFGSQERAQRETNKEEFKKTVEQKMPKLKAEHEKEVKSNAERQFDLTPSDLKLLLPGKGTIRGQFWMRYNPNESWFRSTYPSSNLVFGENMFPYFPISLVPSFLI